MPRTHWCNGDTDAILPRLTGCRIDTWEGAVLLVFAGCVTAWYLLYLRSYVGRAPSSHSVRSLYVVLLLSLALSHVSSIGLHVYHDQHTLHPSKLFYNSAAALLLFLGAVLLFLGTCLRPETPVPKGLSVICVLCAFYASQLAITIKERSSNQENLIMMAFCIFQLLATLALALIDFLRGPIPVSQSSSEHEPLLSSSDVEASPARGPKTKPEGSWIKHLGHSFRYVWPKNPWLQLRAVVCVVLVCLMRCLNLAVPILYKNMVDTLAVITSQAHDQGKTGLYTFMQAFYPWCLLYLCAWILQGGGGVGSIGLVSNARTYLWIPISQDAEKRISVRTFSHVMDLDLSFHLRRKTGEVLRIMDRGNSSMKSLLSTILFSIGPAVFDVLGATVYLSTQEPWMACILLVSIILYIPVTVVITEFRGTLRREMNQMDNKRNSKVKYFTNEELEANNYSQAIIAYQTSEFKMGVSLVALNMIQCIIMFAGMSSGMIVCVSRVAKGDLTVGDVVLFITLMAQLYAPLNYFGSYYRVIQQYMIDMENMFDLLATKSSVTDAPGAKKLTLHNAALEFRDVSFGYTASMQVPGGQTIALVGATGAGKSTILRMVFRFYDPTSGAVLLDGTDIRTVTQQSLRSHIGMVPQDTVLFNDTVEYNIGYGRTSASKQEIQEAAQAASLHESIMARFPQQYDTVVGERGLRLSGGEKQRVALARAILKNPSLLVLDEATSALDSITEKQIQDCLRGLRDMRTTMIVAHRLSTVMDADIIVVLAHGSVVEMGSHAELLSKKGNYFQMWTRQQSSASMGDLALIAGL